MPAPNSSATTFVVHTAGSRIMRMSMRGLPERSSTATQPAASAAAAANRPIVSGEDQPQALPLLSGSSSATSQAESRPAAAQLTLPLERLGDGGTNRQASRPVTTTTPSGIQNSQRQLSAATTGPASTMPMPPPSAMTAD